jgi:hypothetical protein
MDEKRMKVFVTKWCLTNGIQELEVLEAGDGMVEVKEPGWCCTYLHKGEWHRDRAAAVTKAEEMRARKIESVKKSLAKLEAMRFS